MVKNAALFLFFLLAFSVSSIAQSATAQTSASITPQFTLTLIDASHYVPRSISYDPYTNETIVTGDYVLGNLTVVLRIQNQPFTSTTLPDGNTTQLQYLVRFKGHFADWGADDHYSSAVQLPTPVLCCPLRE